MTRAEDVDAAIERAQDDIGRHFSPKYQAHTDRALLATEVVRLREEAIAYREVVDDLYGQVRYLRDIAFGEGEVG